MLKLNQFLNLHNIKIKKCTKIKNFNVSKYQPSSYEHRFCCYLLIAIIWNVFTLGFHVTNVVQFLGMAHKI